MKKHRFTPSTTLIILLSFLLTILLGSLLLSLPISAADREPLPYVDALFTATTATCVTGLVTVPTAFAWSSFGQAVILVLMQIGGLGVITVLSGVMLALHKKMKLSDTLLLQDAFNLNTLAGMAAFIKKVMFGTFLIEGIGALLYMFVFVPAFGARGIWISVFQSVSAFCNAGMDIIGDNSLVNYVGHPLINLVTCLLIVFGGIGYIVWWDLLRVWKEARHRKGRWFSYLTLHSKIALTASAGLIAVGAVLFFAFEYNNPETLGNLSFYDKIQAAFFQSVTTRTAGFASISQKGLTGASVMVSLVLMFIGGSPVGTAGGIKTVTLVALFATAFATFKNKNEVTLFHRQLSKRSISKAVAVAGMAFFILFLSTLALSLATDAPLTDVLYETVSATATVGLSRDLTPLLNTVGKLIIIVTMYLGRVGPISLAILFNTKKESQNLLSDPTEEISIG